MGSASNTGNDRSAPADVMSRPGPLGISALAGIAWSVGLASLVAGFVLVPNGFAGNALAGVFGIAVGVGVALSLVDRISRREREREWSRVGLRTTRAIKRRIWNIASDYWVEAQRTLPITDEEFSEGMSLHQPETTTAQTIVRLGEAMRAVYPARASGEGWDADPENPTIESPESLHAAVADDFRYIKTVLTPRVLGLGVDAELSALLLQLEDHEEDWIGWMTTSRDWGAPESIAWERATATLEVAAVIYNRLAEPRTGLPYGHGDDWEASVPH